MTRLRRRSLLGLGAGLMAGSLAQAQSAPPAEVRGELGEVRLQGQGRMRFLGLSIYDIRLWTAAPLAAEEAARQPLALEIEYARSLVGSQIAERSLTEMQRAAPVDEPTAQRWLASMKQLFPDVKAGDRITGVQRPGQLTRFFVNGRLAGEVRDAAFTTQFFAIWLGRQTSEPGLRAQLLGLPR
jgi:hypothetical protein